jgi:heterotetrameric sarcosine oxidase gamma subunit
MIPREGGCVARLLARTPAEGLGLPLSIGGARLSEVDLGPVTSIAPFAGRAEEVAARLGAMPPPGRVVAVEGGRLLWTGPGRALLVGRTAPDLGGLAAVVEQGDGIAGVLLEGAHARDVLARVVPLDLRDGTFPEEATARTLLNHMAVTLTRVGAEAWEVMAMRSMAATLVSELAEAMRHVEARA